MRKWLATDESGQPERPSELKVPIICELMPLRWSYESMVIAQDKLNPLAKMVAEIEAEKEALLNLPDLNGDGMSDLDAAQLEELNDLKDAQAMLFGLEADGSWSNITGHGLCNTTTFFMNCSSKIEGLATATGRVGASIDRALIYFQGGGAWGRESETISNVAWRRLPPRSRAISP